MHQFVIGDIHGQLEKLTRLLRQAQLVDDALSWTGNDATLWFMGDFVDRGPSGIAVIDLVMRLQREAAVEGGAVKALLGNHDALFLAAHRFGDRGSSFMASWHRNGGVDTDLAGLQPHHVAWIEALPAMARLDDVLLAHADARLYTRYGRSVDAVNAAFTTLLHSDEPKAWHQLLDDFSEHRAFTGLRGDHRADQFLKAFDARRYIHGHTPISKITKQRPEDVFAPLIYARRRCINVDGGLYLGGAGFLLPLETI